VAEGGGGALVGGALGGLGGLLLAWARWPPASARWSPGLIAAGLTGAGIGAAVVGWPARWSTGAC
jgi:hypothetical protein